MRESEGFVAALDRMGSPIRKKWAAMKARLAVQIPPGADFKRWPPNGKDGFSVRLDRNFRAHLQYQREGNAWLATEVGSHKALGHG